MRRTIYILGLVFLASTVTSFGRGNLTAYLSCSSFNVSSGHSYYETYLTVIGQTIAFAKDSNNKFQGKVNVTISFLKGDSVITGAKYNLRSVEIADTLKRPDFLDVQRFWLPNGTYTMQIKMKDANNPNSRAVSVEKKVDIGYNTDSVNISDPEMLESYAATDKTGILDKDGYEMVPYVYTYYPEEINTLKFYAEVYNAYKISGLHEKFIVSYFIESAETHVKLFEFSKVSIEQADSVNPLLGGFNIQDLPSGSYFLGIEVIDKTNTVKASKLYNFIRHNPHAEVSMKSLASVNIANTFVNKITNKDTLVEDIKCLYPISNLSEKDFANSKGLRDVDFTLLKQYFYNFWQVRNPSDPEDAWQKYLVQVKAVNKSFGTYGMKGYQTDRGRVYLQYGAPSQRAVFDMNPATYPYEIWQYYKLPDGQVNTKFVFYDPDIVTNNYSLLHSTARGEIQNRQWQLILYSRTGQPANVDANNQTDPFGEQTLDEFNNPR